MNIAVICFTEHGAVLAERLSKEFSEREMTCRAWIKKKEAQIPDCRNVQVLTQSLREWTKEQFAAVDAMIFIGATGIAVRSIAPYVRSKKTDPAVIVVDEQGRHAISLLSGHIGGANALTLLVSEWIGAEPVITTATDLHGKFAVDAFAARRDLYIDSMSLAKEIAAALVEDKKVGICSAFPVLGTVPAELTQVENLYGVESDGTKAEIQNLLPLGFSITYRKNRPFPHTLHLVPKTVVLGIGCKRGTEAESIRALIRETLEQNQIFKESICLIASIDLKKDEEGIRICAEELGVPFVTWSAEELEQVRSEDGFTESAFVRSVAGVGNVCERSALKGAGTSRLLIRKTAHNGVTVAAAVKDYTVCMED